MMERGNYRASSWRVVLVLFFLTSLVESAGMSHVFAFMPVYLQDIHTQHIKEWVGILSSITFVTGLPLVPMWGIWAQRIGGKAVIMRSAYVEMVVFVVLALSHNLSGVFVAMMLVGFQLGNTGIMLAALRAAAPERRIGFAVSVFSVSSSIGMAGGPLLGGLLTGFHVLDLHGLYILDGILSFVTGTMLWVFYRQPHQPKAVTDDGVRVHQGSAWREAWKSVQFTFSLRITWVLFGVYTVLMMARQMVTPYLPIVIEHLNLHFSSPTFIIGVLMGLTALVGAVITVVAGRLGDRLGFVRILVASFVVSIPAAVVLGLLSNTLAFAGALTLFSAGYSIGSAMIFALFSTRIPESHRSTAMNLVYLPLYFGGIVGPTVASALTHVALFAPFMGAGLFLIIGLLVVLTTLARRRPSLQSHQETTFV